MYYIYRHETPEGKSYIGKTLNPKARYNNGNGYKQCPKFWKAINKFGWNNIKHEILITTEDEAEARKLEKIMIKKFNSIENGYNSCNTTIIRKYIPKGLENIYGKYNKEGNLIDTYNGDKELREHGFFPHKIYWNLQGKTKMAYGYIWKIIGKKKKENHITECHCKTPLIML